MMNKKLDTFLAIATMVFSVFLIITSMSYHRGLYISNFIYKTYFSSLLLINFFTIAFILFRIKHIKKLNKKSVLIVFGFLSASGMYFIFFGFYQILDLYYPTIKTATIHQCKTYSEGTNLLKGYKIRYIEDISNNERYVISSSQQYFIGGNSLDFSNKCLSQDYQIKYLPNTRKVLDLIKL